MPDSQCYELADSQIAEEDLLGGRGERHWVISTDLWNQYYTQSLEGIAPPYMQPFPGYPKFSIVKVARRPWHSGETEKGYQGYDGPWLWEVIVYYQTLWDPADGPMISIKTTCDVLDVSNGGFWASDQMPANDQAINMLFPCTELTFEESQLDNINVPLIMSMQGNLNQYPFTVPIINSPVDIGCAMFLGSDSKGVWDYNYHKWKFRLQFTFRLRNQDWNQIWRKGKGIFDVRYAASPQSNGQLVTMFGYSDFSAFGFTGV